MKININPPTYSNCAMFFPDFFYIKKAQKEIQFLPQSIDKFRSKAIYMRRVKFIKIETLLKTKTEEGLLSKFKQKGSIRLTC